MRLSILDIAREPPFRLLSKFLVHRLPFNVRQKSFWDFGPRPEYLYGILYAAEQAKRESAKSVSVIEFGVAEGDGLLAMQSHAEKVERATGIKINVYGFDTGEGLPAGTADYRDHSDIWKRGDYKMKLSLLRSKLLQRTTLVLGDVAETAIKHQFVVPIGFMSLDLDFYSSTVAALQMFLRPDIPLLRRIAVFFDDTIGHYVHRFAGELLAINEFNEESESIKIDHWHGIEIGRPFPHAPWLRGMYVAHNLAAISKVKLSRGSATMDY